MQDLRIALVQGATRCGRGELAALVTAPISKRIKRIFSMFTT